MDLYLILFVLFLVKIISFHLILSSIPLVEKKEYCSNGSLLDYLIQHPNLNKEQLIKIVKGISLGKKIFNTVEIPKYWN